MKLADLIHPSYIDLELEAANKVAAITSLARRLEIDGALTSLEAYVAAVLDREKLYSTAVGYGVAIPHGKTEAVARPAVAFGRLARGMAWVDPGAGNAATDDPNELVRMVFLLAVFLLAVPEARAGDAHLRILARLARLLLDEGFRTGLEAARTPAEVLEALERVDATADHAVPGAGDIAASGEEEEEE
ncbi:MAG: PTS sugar transporter subunit IIA [Firmicutes bacterium]|nr:PTS sugar transporter subunit IIA [Bacillota bacterium]